MSMIRTPIYSTLSAPRSKPITDPRLQNDDVGGPEAEKPSRDRERDGYLAKLVKYIPGEVIAAVASIVALSANVSTGPNVRSGAAIAVFVIFLVATPAYFWMGARNLPTEDKPAWYFYLLSLLAFGIWALAVINLVRETFGINAG